MGIDLFFCTVQVYPYKSILYKKGDPDSRLIITAPHGGYYGRDDDDERLEKIEVNGEPKNLTSLPSRTGEGVTTWSDGYTKELAKQLQEDVESKLGIKPHLIVFNIARKRVDVNRSSCRNCPDCKDKDCACTKEHNKDCLVVFDEYHKKISDVKEQISQLGRGLIFDLHGHNHKHKRTEFGYHLSGCRITILDECTDDPCEWSVNSDEKRNLIYAKDTSMYKLLDEEDYMNIREFIFGESSMGGLLEEQDDGTGKFDAIPSPSKKRPDDCHGLEADADIDGYYSGGYSVSTHGSTYDEEKEGPKGDVDAIQIEVPPQHRCGETCTSKKGDEREKQKEEQVSRDFCEFLETSVLAWLDLKVGQVCHTYQFKDHTMVHSLS